MFIEGKDEMSYGVIGRVELGLVNWVDKLPTQIFYEIGKNINAKYQDHNHVLI